MNVIKAFGERLKELRVTKGLKQKDCLTPLGDITITMLSSWENGNSFPRPNYLIKICEFYDTSLDYLLRGVKVDEKYPVPDRYDELINNLLSLLASQLFSIDIQTNYAKSRHYLSISTYDKHLMTFYNEFIELSLSKKYLKEDVYESALKDLINKYKYEIKKESTKETL